ncbi:unnamed protein product [Urochloa decumbens]|uniref:DUF4220 domain-containing protein n=1 Tax=Urochloa decumbens TaxID=240449 RepID=A0ABC9B8N7_9POAL
MAGVLHLWNEWEIQILVLLSFALQVFLLIFAWMRRRIISRALESLLWLMYLLAESTTTYTLGHMSIGCKPSEDQRLMAFWAPFLLVHLGGQDTITAYAMEDNQLWLRHLLTFTVQATGAAYVLYKNIGSHGPLVTPAVLMFLVGILKNGERVWALSFSRLEIIRRYLDGVSIEQDVETYSADTQLDDESVLQGAHDLLYICMGQFVDDKIWPSVFQKNALIFFHREKKTLELIEMQLSLMHDIFYTKAAVIHTWYGRCVRAISLLGTLMAFFLFQFSTGKDNYNRVHAAVTNVLVIGAFALEISSVFRAMGSTWTCAMLKVMKWDCLHSLLVSIRRSVRIAETRRWSAFTGHLNLLDSYSDSHLQRQGLGWKMISYFGNASSMISRDVKELVLKEIQRMVEACAGKEDVMRSFRGQCALERSYECLKDLSSSTRTEFDQSILAWHLATYKFLKNSKSLNADAGHLMEATKAISNYMMFLLVERPYMLPSPVRPTVHLEARKDLLLKKNRPFVLPKHNVTAESLKPGAELGEKLLNKVSKEMTAPKLLQVVLGVWVEMLCYAAHHCSRESHARQLNNGGEFLTIVWLLTTSEFNRCYESQFKERKHG